ncbi:dTDP-4-dehydrorhamnose reductase [Thalassospira sp. MA62]|nr:dTDP-4-dehydrorhamnose reductase [Thalassospira sp. MA62]
MIHALVIGKTGQLAQSLAVKNVEYSGVKLTFLDRTECDLEKPEHIAAVIAGIKPDMVINAAAYTAVDQAESDQNRAQVVNGDAVGAIGAVTAQLAIPVLHFSTDYVFDGQGDRPYGEDDGVAPLGVYGATKRAGEVALAAANAKHLIFRTSWVYSPFGKNFVKTMLGLMAGRDEITVVDDQIGCPTSALDLADAMLKILPQVLKPDFTGFGTYHLVGSNVISWCGFARHIQTAGSDAFGPTWNGASCAITPVGTDAFPTVAKRPAYSVLSVSKFEQAFGFTLPDIDISLRETLTHLAKENDHA